MRAYRDIATVAGAQMVCFSVLTYLEPSLFLIHMYLSVVYIAILVMLYYREDRWAYMIGLLASLVWLVMGYASGLFTRHIARLFAAETADPVARIVGLLAIVTTLLAVLMVVFCSRHWVKEYAGLGKARSTFIVSLGIVVVYYGVLLRWFWDFMPND
jgi:hypothetical protein